MRYNLAKQKEGNGKVTPLADEIFSAIERLINSEPCEIEQRHALKLAEVAFGMEYGEKEGLIRTLLGLRRPAEEKQKLLTVLALAGEVISTDLIMQGIHDLLDAAKDRKKSWMLYDNDGYRLQKWLELLPFSDRPVVILEVLEAVKSISQGLIVPWKLRDLLSALGYAPSTEAGQILEELARLDPEFLNEYEWRSALTKSGTLSSGRTLLNLISNNALTDEKGCGYAGDLGQNLANAISTHPELRTELYQQYEKFSVGPAKAVMEYAIVQVPDIEGLALLIQDYAVRGVPFQHTSLYSAVESITVGKHPSENWIGAHELYGIPATALRKKLFEVVNTGKKNESELSEFCLKYIDKLRDDYGKVESEPRHPDIESNFPWPHI